MTRRNLGTFLLLVILSCGVLLRAQSLESMLKGHVYDVTGAVFPGATITALNTRTGELRTTKTGIRGEYSLQGLPPGKYEFRVESPGCFPDVRVMWISPRTERTVDSVLYAAPTHGYGDVFVLDSKSHQIIADSPEYRGAIRGRVLGQFGGRIPGVRVVAENLDTHESQGSKTGKDGTFIIDGLPKGVYKVRADSNDCWPDIRLARIEYAIDPEIDLQLENR